MIQKPKLVASKLNNNILFYLTETNNFTIAC